MNQESAYVHMYMSLYDYEHFTDGCCASGFTGEASECIIYISVPISWVKDVIEHSEYGQYYFEYIVEKPREDR